MVFLVLGLVESDRVWKLALADSHCPREMELKIDDSSFLSLSPHRNTPEEIVSP